MTNSKKRIITGIQPSGTLHIGNYLGAIRPLLESQNEYEVFLFVVDLHALTTLQDAEKMKKNILDLVRGYLACGIDPEKVTISKQSDIPEHGELAYIFNTITTMPYLMRAHSYKDAEAKNKEINVGTFTYPMLMAADILLYDVDIVPVGKDQQQHVEITRDTAEKFNRTFGEIFKMPEPVVSKEVGVVPGTDGRKMSKSYGNVIPLFATKEEIKKAVMSMPTDSKSPEEPKDTENDNLFALHKLFTADASTFAQVKDGYEKGGMSYKESKDILVESIESFIEPIRERYNSISDSDVKRIIEEGTEKAKKIAASKIEEVKKMMGLTL